MLTTDSSSHTRARRRRARLGATVAGALLVGALSPAMAMAVPIIPPSEPTSADASSGSSTSSGSSDGATTTVRGVPEAAGKGTAGDTPTSNSDDALVGTPTSTTTATATATNKPADGAESTTSTGGKETTPAAPGQYEAAPEDLAITGSTTQTMLAMVAGLGVLVAGLLVAARRHGAGA